MARRAQVSFQMEDDAFLLQVGETISKGRKEGMWCVKKGGQGTERKQGKKMKRYGEKRR